MVDRFYNMIWGKAKPQEWAISVAYWINNNSWG